MLLEHTRVIAQDLIWIIFLDMDSVWLKFMWEGGGTTRADMIEILISLVILKLRIWYVDLLLNNDAMVLTLILIMVWLWDIFCIMRYYV